MRVEFTDKVRRHIAKAFVCMIVSIETCFTDDFREKAHNKNASVTAKLNKCLRYKKNLAKNSTILVRLHTFSFSSDSHSHSRIYQSKKKKKRLNVVVAVEMIAPPHTFRSLDY